MPTLELKTYEAYALVRALVEAKFHGTDVQDPEVLTSPMVARCALEFASQAQREAEIRDGERGRNEWLRWLRCSPDRREWKIAVANACATWRPIWNGWTSDQRLEAVRLLFAPFECTAPEEFIREVVAGMTVSAGAG